MSALRLPRYNPLDEVDALLKRALLNAREDGLPTHQMVMMTRTQLPVVSGLIQNRLFAEFIRQRVRRLRDEQGLPWARSVNLRSKQRSFWSADDYVVVIRGYVKRGRANTSVAERLAQEAERVHGLRVDLVRMAQEDAN